MAPPDLISQALQYVINHGNPIDILGIVLSAVGSAITAMIGFGVKFLRDVSISVNRLSTNIEVLITRTNSIEKLVLDHEGRLRVVEKTTVVLEENIHEQASDQRT